MNINDAGFCSNGLTNYFQCQYIVSVFSMLVKSAMVTVKSLGHQLSDSVKESVAISGQYRPRP
jgi:hypothetical protein